MKRVKLLIALVLTLATITWLVPAQVAAASPRVGADGCPIYMACMEFVGGGGSCAGFICNGKFICGTPVTLP